jgi:hypothetical protein
MNCLLDLIKLFLFQIMKSKDLQKLVLSKYENGDGPTKIFRDLNGAISLATIESGAKASAKAALSICQDHLVVQERFEQKQPFKRSKED